MMKKVAIIGTQGVPARYGGFETLVENIIGDNCSLDIQYTVFCSSKDMPERLENYKGAFLRYVPLRANGVQSIPYDMWSMMKVIGKGFDAVVVLGTSGCMFLPIFRLFCRKKLIVNIDGLEHRRAKWGKVAKWVLRNSERMAVKFADVIIADNQGIADYVKQTYRMNPVVIAYGGDHVQREVSDKFQQDVLKEYGVTAGNYAITVCRVEPENNSRIILEAFAAAGKELIFVGNWDRSEYSRGLKMEFEKYANIHFINSEYNLDRLYALRANCAWYIHGHSAGGTNPSLVEAMFFGRPILCFDVVYNRETTHGKAYYWKNPQGLQSLLERNDLDGNVMKDIAKREYMWKHIAEQYESLY